MANISNDVIIGLSVMAGVVVLFVAAVIVAKYNAKKKILLFDAEMKERMTFGHIRSERLGHVFTTSPRTRRNLIFT